MSAKRRKKKAMLAYHYFLDAPPWWLFRRLISSVSIMYVLESGCVVAKEEVAVYLWKRVSAAWRYVFTLASNLSPTQTG